MEAMRIPQIQTVTTFKKDDEILLSCGRALKQISARLNAKLINLNTPDAAPPEAPRALIQGKDSIASISLNRFEITVRPPEHVQNDLPSCLDFTRLRVEPLMVELLKEVESYLWLGLIVKFQHKLAENNPAVTVVQPIFDKLINVKRGKRDLASFQMQFGFAEGGLFKNYIVAGYEVRNIKVPPGLPIGASFQVNPKNIPIAESGLEISIDVNNRPNSGKGQFAADFKSLLEIQSEEHKAFLTLLNIKEILHD
ncbi:MAG: hypothetical protein KDD51_07985 [Bdellovibrionales bacterium]|nr:hypothetical protein [Bdellovibrionales bacterium]